MTVLFIGGPRHAQILTFAHAPAELGNYVRDRRRSGVLFDAVYRWQG